MSQDARGFRTRFLLRLLEDKFAAAGSARAPEPLDAFGPERLLVVAPHADDEVIGCAGLIRKCLSAGGEVAVLFLTVEGARSIVKPSLREGADRRLLECADAQRILGYQGREHLDFPERSLRRDGPGFEALVGGIEGWLGARDPDALLLPNPEDVHPDHTAASLAAAEAVARLRRAGRLQRLRDALLYEVWGPARLDAYCRLVPEDVALKRRALDCYASQLESVDYHAVMDAIGRARGRALGVLPSPPALEHGGTVEGYERLEVPPRAAARPARVRSAVSLAP